MYNTTLPQQIVKSKICPIIIMSLTRFSSLGSFLTQGVVEVPHANSAKLKLCQSIIF